MKKHDERNICEETHVKKLREEMQWETHVRSNMTEETQ